MSDFKNRAQNLEPNAVARDVKVLAGKTGNVYESLTVVAKRAAQISSAIKRELVEKLEEFTINNDQLEEVHENKEQIEISKFYERLPNPVIMALDEFNHGELRYRFKEDKKEKGL